MGAAMARRVAAAGHDVTVWNRTPAASAALAASLPDGVTAAGTAADAVSRADVVLSMLADGDATCAVLLDTLVVSSRRPEAVVVDLATSGVTAARRLAAELGAAFVDAPVSGSVPAVEAGSLLVMASGPEAAIEAAEPVLASFARAVLRVGDAGAGQAMKLAVNLVVHDLNAALSEALVLAESAGITRENAYDVLQQSVVGAPFVQYKRAAFLDPAAPVAMSLDLVLKDLRLILELAADLDAPAAVTAAALDVVARSVGAGHGGEDMAALSRWLGSDPLS
jgi:3-hydroxyisobutyrate dehydrogenase-like beta-hydroxyacid dehydrogenase